MDVRRKDSKAKLLQATLANLGARAAKNLVEEKIVYRQM